MTKEVQYPKTKMTAEQVAAEVAERNANKAPQINRNISITEHNAWKAHNTLQFNRGTLKK